MSSRIRITSRVVAISLAALAVESLNFRLGGLALDPGQPVNPPMYLKVIGAEWGILHVAGLVVLDWLRQYRSFDPNYPGHYFLPYDWVIVFACGFLATVLLFAIIDGCVRLLRHLRRPVLDLSQ